MHGFAQREKWQSEVNHFEPLIQGIIDQTQRRVFNEEKVPAEQKIFSLFEDHTDIVIKDGREIQYGHKLNLTSGKSGLILDIVIEEGNPADTDRLLPMLERHVEHYEQAPRQVAADGGYTSGANLPSMNWEFLIWHSTRSADWILLIWQKARGYIVN